MWWQQSSISTSNYRHAALALEVLPADLVVKLPRTLTHIVIKVDLQGRICMRTGHHSLKIVRKKHKKGSKMQYNTTKMGEKDVERQKSNFITEVPYVHAKKKS